MSNIRIQEAIKRMGSQEELIEQLALGNIVAEGRYFDFGMYGKGYAGNPHSPIASFYWSDCEYSADTGNLFHSQDHYGFCEIRIQDSQLKMPTRPQGGRPRTFNAQRFYAEIAAAIHLGKIILPESDISKLRKKLQVILPYLREFDEAEDDNAKRSSYHPKTLQRELRDFLGYFNAAQKQLDSDAE